MGIKNSKYKSNQKYKQKNNRFKNKLVFTENKFNHVKVRYTEHGSNISNKTLNYSYTYNGVPGGWYIK